MVMGSSLGGLTLNFIFGSFGFGLIWRGRANPKWVGSQRRLERQ